MGDFPWKIDLKNAYQCIQVHPLHRIFLRLILGRKGKSFNTGVSFSASHPAQNIYKNLETYGGHTPLSWSETSDLFRRRVNSQLNKRGSDKRHNFNSLHFAKFRLGDQLEKS